MEKPTAAEPQPAPPPEPSNTAPPAEPGASDATLTLFLIGVAATLLVCVAFIVIAAR